MLLNEFVNLSSPELYNFEYENEKIVSAGLDSYSRYFAYRANTKNARDSKYENGRKYAENVHKKYGSMCDCDGTIDRNVQDVCMLARYIYRTLWGWSDVENDKLERYGKTSNEKFGMMGPETMNSAQTTVNKIIEAEYDKCKDPQIISIKNGNISANFMLELYSNRYSSGFLIQWLNNVKNLSEFLNLYHTIGNFILVPAYFNPYRANVVGDYWDKSLELLRQKEKVWIYRNNEIQWNKEEFSRYINTFFLWDYVDKNYNPKTISNMNIDVEKFLNKTCQAIRRRGRFMVTMLKVIELNPCYYEELVKGIFDKDCVYDGYIDVIEAIKGESCYRESEIVRGLTNHFERECLND